MGEIIDFEKAKESRELYDGLLTLFNAMKKTKVVVDEETFEMHKDMRSYDFTAAQSQYLEWHDKVWSPE